MKTTASFSFSFSFSLSPHHMTSHHFILYYPTSPHHNHNHTHQVFLPHHHVLPSSYRKVPRIIRLFITHLPTFYNFLLSHPIAFQCRSKIPLSLYIFIYIIHHIIQINQTWMVSFITIIHTYIYTYTHNPLLPTTTTTTTTTISTISTISTPQSPFISPLTHLILTIPMFKISRPRPRLTSSLCISTRCFSRCWTRSYRYGFFPFHS